MIVAASFTGVIKTVLILIGVLVILRIIGRTMIAKRNLEHERDLINREREFEKKKDFVRKNQGKTSILSKGKIQAEDADFEEVR
ncbi:MAG: hypothetical protein K9G36_06570 [Crocinitomicaceae bacterium]|nr:hypothetical protein [Crocinitomicaceae bacterium]MCF8411410.1 hypothetical protein [Crocinitomicaceae bacterium]